jgi:hypothetical protein
MRNEPEYQMALAFQEAWADPTPESLIKLLHRETVLYQPHLPPIRGIGNALREFQLFLEWLPRFRGEVHGFVGEHNVLFIEWTMLFPLGRKDLRVRAIDRITLRDGADPCTRGLLQHASARQADHEDTRRLARLLEIQDIEATHFLMRPFVRDGSRRTKRYSALFGCERARRRVRESIRATR